MYYSQMLLTRRIILENLLTHWALDMIICSMYIPRVSWEVLSVNVLIAISTVNRPCKKLISHVCGGARELAAMVVDLKKRSQNQWIRNILLLSKYQWLTNWYTLCRTRMCFLHEESFLKTFWHTSHWTSVLLWTSRMCLRKFTTVFSQTSHQLFLPKMDLTVNCGKRWSLLSLVCMKRHEAFPTMSIKRGFIAKSPRARGAL